MSSVMDDTDDGPDYWQQQQNEEEYGQRQE